MGSSDRIHQDDNTERIYHAVWESRIIFNSIWKFVLHLISCNLSEMLAILIAALLAFPLALLPLSLRSDRSSLAGTATTDRPTAFKLMASD